ncbi:GTP-binding protein [Salinicola corii]|uniref:GTP-binding protein n=1 Tax=Salinicola corii TaxID=2606937 RepID=A0A640WBZ3_9GAMM|nr:GTP-binding protein [Salinicola corii]KAA0015286.1 GTP-binding protein [Salinicola corii]
MSSTSRNPIPVTLLTGFLGSGKTTLLNRLVRQPGMNRILVVINEFGEIGLDHQLFSATDETEVVALDSGCLCCTVRGDLARTLRDAPWRFSRGGQRQFERVVIETTGLADPAPILHTLMTDPKLVPQYRLDGIVTTVDAAHGLGTLDRHPEAMKQTAIADLLLLTKSDLAEEASLADLRQRLAAINPGAAQRVIKAGEIDAEALIGLRLMDADGTRPDLARWLDGYLDPKPPAMGKLSFSVGATAGLSPMAIGGREGDGLQNDPNRHDDHILAHSFTLDTPIDLARFESWLDLMLALMGENMLRIKGILNIAGRDRPTVIHGVQHIFHPSVELDAWPNEDHRSRLVFITRDIPRESLESVMVAVS